jgi:hypothetical protein
MNDPAKSGPNRSPWPSLIAFIAVLIFGGIGMAFHWNPLDIISVSGTLATLYSVWRLGPG